MRLLTVRRAVRCARLFFFVLRRAVRCAWPFFFIAPRRALRLPIFFSLRRAVRCAALTRKKKIKINLVVNLKLYFHVT
jgi:hypothetical protein